MAVEHRDELSVRDSSYTHGRIHHDYVPTGASPSHDEVRKAIRQLDHGDRGQVFLWQGEHMFSRDDELLGVDAYLRCDAFKRVDRGSIDVSGAYVAQFLVGPWRADPTQQGAKTRRPAIECGRLQHYGRRRLQSTLRGNVNGSSDKSPMPQRVRRR
jgi:hypothetical protein